MKHQQGFATQIIVLGILIFMLVLGSIYYLNNSKQFLTPSSNSESKVNPSGIPLGPTSEAFFDRVAKDMQKVATPSAPMESTSVEPTDWSLPINLTTCFIGERRSQVRGLGSRSLEIKENNKNECILEYVNEVEGGYTESECSLPKSLKAISPPDEDFHKYCKEIKSGNYLLER